MARCKQLCMDPVTARQTFDFAAVCYTERFYSGTWRFFWNERYVLFEGFLFHVIVSEPNFSGVTVLIQGFAPIPVFQLTWSAILYLEENQPFLIHLRSELHRSKPDLVCKQFENATIFGSCIFQGQLRTVPEFLMEITGQTSTWFFPFKTRWFRFVDSQHFR